jgi:flagellar hook-length control protein FliK
MMQNIATAKSDVAAFATGAGYNSSADSESNEQFGKILQDQKTLNSSSGASENASTHRSSKKASQQSNDETNMVRSSGIREDKPTQIKSTSNERSETHDAQKPSLSEVKSAAQSAIEDSASDESELSGLGNHGEKNDKSVSESVAHKLGDELKVANKNADLQWVVPSKKNVIESDLAIESESMVVQEWVSLVDNLQKLADVAKLTEQPLVDVEGQPSDASLAEFTLVNKVDKGLLEQMADNFKVGTDEAGLVSVEDNLLAVNLVQEGQVQDDDVVLLNQQAKQSLSMLVDEALGEVLSNTENEGLSDSDVRQQLVELLLEQPDALQYLNSKLQITSQESGTDAREQKSLDTIIDNVINKDLLLANQQVETSAQVDLTSAENKALLRALLTDPETDKTYTLEPSKLAKPILSEPPEKLIQAQQSEILTTKLESDAEQGELLEQDVQLVQVIPSNIPSTTKTEKVISNIDIKNILNLTDNNREKVLDNIAQRIFDSKKTSEPISPEQIAQQIVIPKVAEIVSAVESSSKDFISALKSGLEEFKNQLSQGREPGIDLKTLVSDALAKTYDKETVAKPPVNLEQVIKSVSQVLDFAQTINRSIEHHQDQTYSATLKEVAQIQGEQSKQIQLNQFESKIEKSINLSKSEGHQQLAEKVRWMVNTKNLVAEIRLDPAELGSVNVKVALSGESVTVNFVVQSQQARDAVDTATPKLREMLAEKGIELGQSSVNQESGGQQNQGDDEFANQTGRSQDEFEDIDLPEQAFAQQNIVNGALGGIDYFV